MFRTNGLNHITLYVQDLERSLRFYTEILRMKLVHQGDDYAYLESGVTWFCISQQPQAQPLHAPEADEGDNLRPPVEHLGLHHLALTVRDEDFLAAVEHLRRHSVPIVREPILRGVGKAVNFLDPDGVQWEFHTSNLTERMTVIEDMERVKK